MEIGMLKLVQCAMGLSMLKLRIIQLNVTSAEEVANYINLLLLVFLALAKEKLHALNVVEQVL